MNKRKPHALVLFSNGLDSRLSVLLLKAAGVRLHALYFHSIFSPTSYSQAQQSMHSFFSPLKIPFNIVDITKPQIKIVKQPRYGYGANCNPCIDCKILMFTRARQYMKKIEADFIVSGEVVGQRPMSQQKSLFALIEKQSKTQQLILRPLSAKLLPPIKVQQQGLIDEQYLLDIYGRGRGRQLALADELGLTEYPTPSGGCLLTDPGFSRRLRDLLRHCPEFNYKQIELLRLGRHFRLSAKTKLVVARDASECQELIRLAGDNKRVELVMPQEAKGPLAVINKGANLASLKLAASIVASYCRYRQKNLEVKIGNKKVEVSLKPRRREIKKFLI